MADSSFISGLRGGAFDGGQGARNRVLQAAVGSSTPARKPLSRCGDGDDPAPLESSRRTGLNSAIKLVGCAATGHWGSDLMIGEQAFTEGFRDQVEASQTHHGDQIGDSLAKEPPPGCNADAYRHCPLLIANLCRDLQRPPATPVRPSLRVQPPGLDVSARDSGEDARLMQVLRGRWDVCLAQLYSSVLTPSAVSDLAHSESQNPAATQSTLKGIRVSFVFTEQGTAHHGLSASALQMSLVQLHLRI